MPWTSRSMCCIRVTAMPSLMAKASSLSSDDLWVSSKPLTSSLARLGSRILLIMSMPTLMSCSSSWDSNLFVSARARLVGIATTAKEVRSGSVKRSCSLIMRNWNERSRSGISPPSPSQPKRSRKRATRSARRSRKSGKLSSRRACPVGAMSMTMWSNFSVSTSSSSSTSATISSLPGGSVSKRFTKSSIGSCCSTWPTRPPASSRRCNASRTVAWKRCMAAPVSTSIAQSSPGPMRASTFVASSESCTPRASPREWAGSVETASTRLPWPAARTAKAELMEVLPTPPLPPKSTTSLSGGKLEQAPSYATVARYPRAGTPTSDSGLSATSNKGRLLPAHSRRSSSRT
mmetsp:Transcript_42377/g.132084  ORF Transcript_42377/g.132084 Transcript_42377/m.132084 type:complete len:347 (+) Transcript_42377:431-1471(+)